MRFRARVKHFLYGSFPGIRGHFPYFGQDVYFPLGSHIFERACEEGIYEHDVLNLILTLVEPGTTYFDVGANIGLLSVPVLSQRPGVKVVSIEASPSTLPSLTKSRSDSSYQDRWTIVGTAVGDHSGETEFWSGGGASGAFDGVHNTGRGGEKAVTRLPMRTLDDIWHELGEPAVSVVKMDIEGGEMAAFKGAHNLVSKSHPVFIVEWNEENLRAYGVNIGELLDISRAIGYQVIAFPQLLPIETKAILKVAMLTTETFVLIPLDGSSSPDLPTESTRLNERVTASTLSENSTGTVYA